MAKRRLGSGRWWGEAPEWPRGAREGLRIFVELKGIRPKRSPSRVHDLPGTNPRVAKARRP
jgi:hypothetical protein